MNVARVKIVLFLSLAMAFACHVAGQAQVKTKTLAEKRSMEIQDPFGLVWQVVVTTSSRFGDTGLGLIDRTVLEFALSNRSEKTQLKLEL